MNKLRIVSLGFLVAMALTACGGGGGSDDGGSDNSDNNGNNNSPVDTVDPVGNIGTLTADEVVLLSPGTLYDGSYYHRIYEQVLDGQNEDMTGDDRMTGAEDCRVGGNTRLESPNQLIDPQSPYDGGLFEEVHLFYAFCGGENWGDGYLDGHLKTSYPDQNTVSGHFLNEAEEYVIFEEFGFDGSTDTPLLISMPVHIQENAVELSMFGYAHGRVSGRSEISGWSNAHGQFEAFLKTTLETDFGRNKESVQWGNSAEDFRYRFTSGGDTSYSESFHGYYAKEVVRHDDEVVPDTCPQGGAFVQTLTSLIVNHPVGDRANGTIASGVIQLQSGGSAATVSYDDDTISVSLNNGAVVKAYTRAEVAALRQARCGF